MSIIIYITPIPTCDNHCYITPIPTRDNYCIMLFDFVIYYKIFSNALLNCDVHQGFFAFLQVYLACVAMRRFQCLAAV